MRSRPREALEQEVAHIQFLFDELDRWDTSSVPRSARDYLTQRYERQLRILKLVLAEARPAPAPVPVQAAPVPASVQVPAPLEAVVPVEVPAPVEAIAPVEANVLAEVPAPAVAFFAAETPAPEPRVEPEVAEATADEESTPAEDFSYAAFRAEQAREDAERQAPAPGLPKFEEAAGAEVHPLPPVAQEPLFDVPPPRRARTSAARVVEEVSTWDTVWRPFLYESIGWFIGAFLIVAGSLYLAFDSWAGLTSFSRSLVVFGMTAGYSAAFSVCGALLARREALAGAGRILGLIGASVGPFAGVALGPMSELGLAGLSPVLLVPLLLGWSLASARLVRAPAESFDVPSRPLLQGALVGTTLMMGLAPLAARVGGAAVWLNALPCALFFVLARQETPAPRSGRALAFVLGAPSYLLLLYAVRLHLALEASGAPPSLGGYAPFLAFLLLTAARFQPLPEDEAADSLTLGLTALLLGCVALASTGAPPAFFLTALLLVVFVGRLARGGSERLPWLYATYAALYLVYTSVDQLLPGALRASLEAFRASWFPGAEPLQVRAVAALPFVGAGAAVAGWLSREDEEDGEERADVLLRATAWASGLVALASHLGSTMVPAFLCTLVLMGLCLVCGRHFERRYLSTMGAVLGGALVFSTPVLHGAAVASLLCGALALGFALLPRVSAPDTRTAFFAASGWLSVAGFFHALYGGAHGLALVGMALSGAAMLLVAWSLAHPELIAVAAFGAAAVVPKLASFLGPEWVPPALGLVGCGLALLAPRHERLRLLGLSGVAYALLAFGWGAALHVSWFGVTVVLAAAAVGVASRLSPGVRPLAVVFGGVALLPRLLGLEVWPWMTPQLSMALLALGSLGASVYAARRGRDASTFTAGLVALLYPVLVMGSASRPATFLCLCAGLAALFTARTLQPTVSVVATTLWGLGLLGTWYDVPGGLLLASFLSALALVGAQARARQVLTGGRPFSLVATLCALPLVLAACLHATPSEAPWVLVCAVALPLLWTRANRQPLFAALSPLLVLGLVRHVPELRPVAALLPLLALALVRAVEHLPVARRLLLGAEVEERSESLSTLMQGALVVVGGLLVLSWNVRPEVFAPLVAALVLMPGPRPSVRVGLGAALLFFCVPLHPVGLVLLLGLGLLTHHLPERLWAFFRAPEDAVLRPVTVLGALGLATGSLVLGVPTPGAIGVLAGVLLVSAFLLSQGWMLALSVLVFAGASLGHTSTHAFLEWREAAARHFMLVALASAALSALCQRDGVQQALRRAVARVTPGLDTPWSEPLWFAGAVALAVPLARQLAVEGPGSLSLPAALLGGAAALLLMVTRERWLAVVPVGLLGGVLVAAVPPEWAPAVLAGTGLGLCMLGTWLENHDLEVGESLHHAGWVMSLVALLGLRSWTHPGLPVCVLLSLGSVWAVVYRDREREALGWMASLVAEHVLLMHVGARLSTGKGPALILPLFSAGSALLASLALTRAGESVRRSLGHFIAGVSLVELVVGLVLVSGSPDSVRGALVACGCLAVLFLVLVRHAVQEEDERSAFLAQWTLACGYLATRLHALGGGLGTMDSVVALVGGVLFSGLYVLAQREGAGLSVFRRPALWGAFLFPMAGLLTAPWNEPVQAAALLVGHAAHFAALASHPSQRGVASMVSAAAFNAALFVVWTGTGAGEPQFYVIPAGLSLLVLLRVFEDDLEPETYAKLRALAITFIYVAGAWRALLFSGGGAMVACVVVCVLGVVAGVALRIRSYVYLGTAFLVTCVVANLARFGMRDHRVGAVSLSLLGLGTLGFMILFTSKRAELLERYERVRALLDTWEA